MVSRVNKEDESSSDESHSKFSEIDHVQFQFPEPGSYLCEVEGEVFTRLLHEADGEADDDKVIRVLNDFFIFDPRSLQLVPVSYLWDQASDGLCEAFGWATVDVEDEEEDDREIDSGDGVLFRTSAILTYYSLDIHQDSIWIETQYAWYILQTPAKFYRPLFIPFYSREILLRIILRTIKKNPEMAEENLLRQLASPAARDPITGKCWNNEAILTHCQYTRTELFDTVMPISNIEWDDIKHAPLLQLIFQSSSENRMSMDRLDRSSPVNLPPSRAPPRKKKRAHRVMTAETTTVTPTVYALSSSFFDTEFTVVGDTPSTLNKKTLSRNRPESYTISGSDYKPGDYVIVNEKDFEDETGLRFAQILFFDTRKKNFHARWFLHGSETILQELAHGQELFLSLADRCRSVPVDCLISKCKVTRITLADHAKQNWPPKDSYFYSSAWDRNNPVDFVEVTKDQVRVPTARMCSSCDEREEPIAEFISKSKCKIRSRDYHKHDYIRYSASTKAATQVTCSIGQIISFSDSGNGVKILVHKMGRERDRQNPGYFSEPALFLTFSKEILDAAVILGPCQVIHIEEYRQKEHDWFERNPDCFYVQSQAKSLNSPLSDLSVAEFQSCTVCREQLQDLSELESQCRKEKTLRAFDPYIGVGGFGLGLSRGCAMVTQLGVELNPSAAETTRRNFPPETVVVNADANFFLRDMIKGHEKRIVRGKIDLVYSGPPCQNDSTLNRHKTEQKRPILTALSFVDVIRPDFFILESVPGFLQWKIFKDTPDEIHAGDLKLVIKILRFLGYNVAAQLMNSRPYGVPQIRDRFFIVATSPEYGPFKFPEPSHAYNPEKGSKGTGARICKTFRLRIQTGIGKALHKVVTVSEALSDLPRFDWENPNLKVLTREQRKAALARAKIIPTVPCLPGGKWGIHDSEFEYETPNTNAFQYRARKDMVFCAEKHYQHFTKHFPAHQVQNICDIPLAVGADYRHIDQKKRDWSLRDPASAKAMGGYTGGAYTRLDPDGYFQTIVTNVGPVAKQSAVLHPSCKRILTVRELARAQGFPDDFEFFSYTDNIDEYHRQIGNSVPFGVSEALGRSIQELVFKKWQRERAYQKVA